MNADGLVYFVERTPVPRNQLGALFNGFFKVRTGGPTSASPDEGNGKIHFWLCGDFRSHFFKELFSARLPGTTLYSTAPNKVQVLN
jgi:hypothetical protein